MKKQFAETFDIRKPFCNPQLRVVKLAGADVISTSSNEGYQDGDTSDWFGNAPKRTYPGQRMQKYFYMALAAMAVLSSCERNGGSEIEAPVNETGKQSLIFTATTEDAPVSRATFNGQYKCASWEEGDKISINGNPFYAGSAGTTTTFMSPATQEVRPTYVFSESRGNTGETVDKLVDAAGTATKWCAPVNKQSWWNYYRWDIVVKIDHPARLRAIKLWNGNDTYQHPERRWKNVNVWGTTADRWDQENPNFGWEEIKSFKNIDLANNQNDLFAGILQVNATKQYEYYLLEVEDNEGGDYMQMSDMTFVYELDEGSDDALTLDDAPFHAYFPASLYDGTTATLPANPTEDWQDGKFNMPMYATSMTTDLNFKNLCAVLKITVKSDDIASVRSINVSSANCATCGAFTVNAENAAVLDNPTDIFQNVTITYNTAVETDDAGKVFYVPLPAQTYRDLVIKISDGVSYQNDKYMATKSGMDIVVERNKMYPIDFTANHQPTLQNTRTATIGGEDVEVPWVQMWENGPKFAAYNVGVTDARPESYGGYYAAGGIQDRVDDHYEYTGSDNLPAEYDTATRIWGNNWRMPTGAELQGLIDHCDIERVVVIGNHAGTRFTGRDAYADCTLFLPAAGYCAMGGEVHNDYAQNNDEFKGQYWSSTNKLAGYFWSCLTLDRDNTYMGADMAVQGLSVRAVVNE